MTLPPLQALVCFATVARHMSMKAAAEELCITASAVSQQIARLEAWLNVRLFMRGPRFLALTAEGHIYLRAIQPAFSQISQATQRLMDNASQSKVTVSCTPGFAIQWLLPRLGAFEKLHPGVEVQINTTNRVVNLSNEGIDFAVRHGAGVYPGLQSHCLVNDHLLPVCSPALLAENRPGSPRELLNYPLLHDEHRLDWRLWFDTQGIEDVDTDKGPVFIDSNGVIEAALAGRGVALVRRALVAEALSSGRLICPLAITVASPIAYYLVYDESAVLQRMSRDFRDWLLATAASEEHRWPYP